MDEFPDDLLSALEGPEAAEAARRIVDSMRSCATGPPSEEAATLINDVVRRLFEADDEEELVAAGFFISAVIACIGQAFAQALNAIEESGGHWEGWVLK